LFVAAMLATAAMLVLTNAPRPFGLLLLLLPVLFAVPMVREAHRAREAKGEASRALARYDDRVMAAVLIYLACMIGAANLAHAVSRGSILLWPIGLLPTLPILAVVWAMRRYLAEETDEYLRHQAVTAALIGLAALLVLATAWGFLEIFGLVPHAGAWWAVPVFVVLRDSVRAWLKVRNR
jgi:hypothetical protein